MSALLHKQLSTSSLFAWCGVDAATPTGTKARGHFTATPANVPGVSRLCKAKGLGGLGPTFEPQHLLSDMTCIKSHVSTQACYVTKQPKFTHLESQHAALVISCHQCAEPVSRRDLRNATRGHPLRKAALDLDKRKRLEGDKNQ